MKGIAKWIVIIWSILTVLGLCYGIMNVAGTLSTPQNEYESAGQGIGMGCGFGIWFVIWAAIAGPALVVFLVSGKKETTRVEIIQNPPPIYSSPPGVVGSDEKKCPYCAEVIKREARVCRFCNRDLNIPNQTSTENKIAPESKNTQADILESTRICPKCGIPMVIKVANQGDHQGKKFFVCPNYKDCQQFLPVE